MDEDLLAVGCGAKACAEERSRNAALIILIIIIIIALLVVWIVLLIALLYARSDRWNSKKKVRSRNNLFGGADHN